MSARRAASGSTRFPWEWRLSDLNPPEEGAPKVFSTFACGGGSSMGYKLAGYEVVGNCEIDPRIAEVYDRNLHPKRSYVMDIRDFNKLEELPDELYDLDVLDGSPPCSTFSMAGSREKAWGVEKRFAEGQKVQRLDDLFFAYLDTVEKLRPKAFIAENVTGIIMGNARGYVSEIVDRSRGLGYSVQIFKLNAAFMGVPQRRERVFFVGNRMGWPKLRLEFDQEPIVFGDVRTPRGGKQVEERISRLVQYRMHGERNLNAAAKRIPFDGGGKTYNIPYYTVHMVDDDRVCPTVTASASITRRCDLTYFSEGDLRNVSSFPQDYDFGDADAQFICGMSVPPVMMAHIASEVRRQWLEG